MSRQRYLGIIEGFYGKPWSWQARAAYPGFLRENGLNTYVYAPKSDSYLRANWRQPWPEEELETLAGLAASCSAAGITFGVGLSPLGLAGEGSAADYALLDSKLEQIASLGGVLLCVLFDDIPSTGKSMANSQLKLCEHIRRVAGPGQMIVCPSYYSTDPVLEKLFGQRPARYWKELGSGLDDDIDFFWTGERVCSEDYSEDNLDFIANEFRRLPVLWDNYPVNDGEKSSRFLHLQPFSGRQSFLSSYTAGHIANPMNQPYIYRLPLVTLSSIYADKKRDDNREHRREYRRTLWQSYIDEHLGEMGAKLLKDTELFSLRGLDALDSEDRQVYADRYRAFVSSRASGEVGEYAREIVAWLEGDYEFDPACLTG